MVIEPWKMVNNRDLTMKTWKKMWMFHAIFNRIYDESHSQMGIKHGWYLENPRTTMTFSWGWWISEQTMFDYWRATAENRVSTGKMRIHDQQQLSAWWMGLGWFRKEFLIIHPTLGSWEEVWFQMFQHVPAIYGLVWVKISITEFLAGTPCTCWWISRGVCLEIKKITDLANPEILYPSIPFHPCVLLV